VAPWLPGLADVSRPPRTSRVRAAFAGLAAVHQRLAAFEATRGTSPGLAARLDESVRLINAELADLEALAGRDLADPLAGTALRWTAMARVGLPPMVARLQKAAARVVPILPVLRDARAEHFLFCEDRLTGLVDFGAMGLDSVAVDLARLLAEMVGLDSSVRTEAFDAYEAIRPLDASESTLIDAFAESAAWLGPARWIRWHFVERRRFDNHDVIRLGLERAMERLMERLTS
jgi:Ser/Thr protein kinase RdoA (MazF antagonist)